MKLTTSPSSFSPAQARIALAALVFTASSCFQGSLHDATFSGADAMTRTLARGVLHGDDPVLGVDEAQDYLICAGFSVGDVRSYLHALLREYLAANRCDRNAAWEAACEAAGEASGIGGDEDELGLPNGGGA